MKNLLFITLTSIAFSFASCGNGSSKKPISAADSIRLQDSIDALIQAEQEALEIQQAEAAAEFAAQEAAKSGRGLAVDR